MLQLVSPPPCITSMNRSVISVRVPSSILKLLKHYPSPPQCTRKALVAECEDNGCIVFCCEDVVRGAAGDACFVTRVKGAGDVLVHVVVEIISGC